MNEKFYKLAIEKRLSIINSGLEIFGRFDYKKASTEEIAFKAGISKGLLFHYFNNKEAYFKFLYNYAADAIESKIKSSSYKETDDFFEALGIVAEVKCSLLKDNPYILQFLVTAQCSRDDKVKQIVSEKINKEQNKYLEDLMKKIDYSKFKKDINPTDILEILGYSLEGYLQSKLRNNESVILEEIMDKYNSWIKILKKSAYY